jgi:hypothetical protein
MHRAFEKESGLSLLVLLFLILQSECSSDGTCLCSAMNWRELDLLRQHFLDPTSVSETHLHKT